MTNTINFNRITTSLLNQTFDSIFYQFFHLEDYLDRSDTHVKEWVIVKLVTIIEQFCREIVKHQIDNKKYKQLPEKLQINIFDLERAKELPTRFLIASQYNFQNTSAIVKVLDNYKISDIFDDGVKHNIDELFHTRHDIVHTTSKQDYDIKKGYNATQKLLKRILNKSSLDSTHYDNIHGYYLGKNGKLDKAMDCFNHALKMDPTNIIAHYYVGITQCITYSVDNAYDRATTIIHLDPKNPHGYYLKGFVFMKQKKYHKAIDCFKQTIQLHPKHHDAMYQRCVALIMLNRYDEAASFGYIPNEINSEYTSIVIEITKVLVEINKHDKALKFLNKELNIRPNNSDAHYGKYIVFYELGKHDEAKQCLNEANKLNPDSNYPAHPNDKKENVGN
ncbi:MAG: Tetratricopeptide repeat-containing protein [Cenarchaeum symbiont of Oopsacas minuta]|nr:Tetratricopeptide repeat-containing protein [Cenarchaeum symbiont of Oopsacas minuta]